MHYCPTPPHKLDQSWSLSPRSHETNIRQVNFKTRPWHFPNVANLLCKRDLKQTDPCKWICMDNKHLQILIPLLPRPSDLKSSSVHRPSLINDSPTWRNNGENLPWCSVASLVGGYFGKHNGRWKHIHIMDKHSCVLAKAPPFPTKKTRELQFLTQLSVKKYVVYSLTFEGIRGTLNLQIKMKTSQTPSATLSNIYCSCLRFQQNDAKVANDL